MHRIAGDVRALGLALLLAAVAVPLAAQSHRAAITAMGGGSVHGDLTPGLSTPTTFQSGWIAGLQLETWLGSGRFGVRLNGLYTKRPLEDAAGEHTVMAGDLDLMLRLLPAYTDRLVAPYLAVGGGATRYSPAEGDAPIGLGTYGENPVRLHVLGALGTDIALSRHAGLRLEVGDKIVLPSIGESPPSTGLPTTHNWMMMAGLQLRLGQLWTAFMGGRTRNRPSGVAPAVADRPARAAAEPHYTVQLGTFMDGPAADQWVESLGWRGIPVWQTSMTVEDQRISRVRVGAFTTEADAEAMVAFLRTEYNVGVRVDAVGPKDAPPAGAVAATRRFMDER
jgi:hypothetical protein